MRNKDKIMEAEFSYYNAPLSNVTPAKSIRVSKMISLLRAKGDLVLKTIGLRYSANNSETYRKLKTSNFPYVTFSGTFTRRSNSALIKHSGLICIDLDHLGDNITLVKSKLEKDLEHIVMYFTSPGGEGLKVVYPIDLGIAPHDKWVVQYESHLRKITGITNLEVDRQCKDVARACLIPHDSMAFLNPMLDYKMQPDVVPVEFDKNLQTSYESDDSSPAFVNHSEDEGISLEVKYLILGETKLDFDDLNTEDNFVRLCRMTQRKEGQYVRPRKIWIHKLAFRCNLFGMDESFCKKCVLKYFSNHPVSNDRNDPLKVEEHFIRPIESTYRTYRDNHGTWIKLETNSFDTPLLPEDVFKNLPELLNDGCKLFHDKREKDIFLLGLITIWSGCMPNLKGIYDKRIVEANIFLMIVASAASGKGTLKWAFQALNTIIKNQREEYQNELIVYKQNGNEDGKKGSKPIRKSIIIPGNTSTTAIIQALEENSERGIIYETEADTIANTMKNDWGNYSYILRSMFHHERISYRRRNDNEFVEIEHPCVSALLSGTPAQVDSLFGDTENGLTSRFLFYQFKSEVYWKDVFKDEGNNSVFLDYMNHRLPETTRFLYGRCKEIEKCVFEFTSLQQRKFHNIFEYWLLESEELLGNSCVATIKRLGLFHFRIAMILTAIRQMDQLKSDTIIICKDEDFETAMSMVECLKLHSFKVISKLKKSNNKKKFFSNNQQMAYFLYLKKTFTRSIADAMAKTMKLNLKTSEKYLNDYISKGLLQRISHGEYAKTAFGTSLE